MKDNNQILDEYLSRITAKSTAIKNQIEQFYQAHSDDPDIEFSLHDSICIELSDFEFEFNMSAPGALEGTPQARISFYKTNEIYLELASYPVKLLRRRFKSTEV